MTFPLYFLLEFIEIQSKEQHSTDEVLIDDYCSIISEELTNLNLTQEENAQCFIVNFLRFKSEISSWEHFTSMHEVLIIDIILFPSGTLYI